MKRILGLILVSIMLMTMILPVSAEGALDAVTRSSLLKVPSNDATLIDNLNLNFDGVTFTSSDSAVINPTTGVVTRPEQTKNVTLTATAGSETKEFAFRVPGKFEEVGVGKAIPQSAQAIWSTDFAGTTIDTTHVSLDAQASAAGATEQNNELIVKGLGADVSIAPAGLGKSIGGKFVVEFVAKRPSASGKIVAQFFGQGGLVLKLSSWGGAITLARNDNSTAVVPAYGGEGGGQHLMDDGHVKTTVYFDTVNGTYDLWINNIFVEQGANPVSDFQYVLFQVGEAAGDWGTTEYYIDDFKAYYVEPETTFYCDTFDGSSLPANVTTPNTALKVDGALKATSLFSLNLNDAGTNMYGKINTHFTITRPAVTTDENSQFWIRDASGNNLVSFTWWYASSGLYIYNKSDGTYNVYPSVNGTKTLSILVSIDTETNDAKVVVNNVAYVGKTQTKNTGVAQLVVQDNKNVQKYSLTDVNCYGNGSYTLEETTGFYNDTFEGTTVPSSVISGIAKNAGGALTPQHNFVLDINETTTTANGKVMVEFTGWRDGWKYPTAEIYIRDANNKPWVYFQWTGAAVGDHAIRTNYRATAEAAPSYVRTATTTSAHTRTFKVEIDTNTGAIKVWIAGTLVADGYSYDASASDSVDNFYLGVPNSGGDIMALQDINCYKITSETITTPTYVPETAPEVSAMAIDYNAYDRKVNILSPAAEDVTVIAAAYAGSGASRTLISAIPADVTLVEDGSAVADTSALLTDGANSVVIYLWSDMGGLQPLYAANPVSGAISLN